jgi:D-alanyl-D-alanine carboxypeptidase
MSIRTRTLSAGCAAMLLFGACSSIVPPPQSSASSIASTVDPVTTVNPTTTAPTSTTEPLLGFVERTGAFIDDLVLDGQFSGVALIADGDEVVYERAAGLADRESNAPIGMTTRFNLGSMNKMFTAVAILQLMERDLLRLEGTIAEYLPDYPNREVAEQVAIEHLLTHASGLGDVFTAQFEANPHRYRTNADYLPLFVDDPLEFAPGERFLYSNAGYVVLGLTIERLTGLSYDEYVRSNIFEPAGMLDTGSHDVDDDVADLAVGYTFVDIHGNHTGVLGPNTSMMPGRGFAAGGGYSTAGDLLRFRNTLLGGRLLSPASLDLLITGKVEVAANTQYAFGFFDRVEAGQRVVGHTGGAPGVCSFLNIYPETGYTVVVLSNWDDDCLPVLTHLKDHPPTG